MHKLNLFILEVERQKSSVIVTVFKKSVLYSEFTGLI